MLRRIDSRWLAMALIVAMMLPASAWSQDTEVLDEAARTLHNRAVAELNSGNIEQAIALLNTAIATSVAAKGPDSRAPNILYLSLGRAYQKKNWCSDAEENYLITISAGTPKVAKPPADVVLAQASKFVEELKGQSTCMARLRVKCEPRSALVKIGDSAEEPCDERRSRYVPAGKVTLTISVADKSRQIVEEVAAREDRTLRLELDMTEPKKDPIVIKEPKKDPVVIKETIIREKSGQEKLVVPKVINNIDIQNGEAFNGPVFFANLVLSAAVVTAFAAYDTCGFQYGTKKGLYDAAQRANMPYEESFCSHTYNGKFDALDLIPTAGYLVGLGILFIQPIQF